MHHCIVSKVSDSLAGLSSVFTFQSLLIFALYIMSKIFSWFSGGTREKCVYSVFLEEEAMVYF